METEAARLREGWRDAGVQASNSQIAVLAEGQRAGFDPFDLAQLDFVLHVCRESKTLSDAGRKLFAVSRAKRSKMNDADRLKKYLARFKLSWDQLMK